MGDCKLSPLELSGDNLHVMRKAGENCLPSWTVTFRCGTPSRTVTTKYGTYKYVRRDFVTPYYVTMKDGGNLVRQNSPLPCTVTP